MYSWSATKIADAVRLGRANRILEGPPVTANFPTATIVVVIAIATVEVAVAIATNQFFYKSADRSRKDSFSNVPIALCTYRMLLMFFTSVRVPQGSVGRWTEIFASTRKWPNSICPSQVLIFRSKICNSWTKQCASCPLWMFGSVMISINPMPEKDEKLQLQAQLLCHVIPYRLIWQSSFRSQMLRCKILCFPPPQIVHRHQNLCVSSGTLKQKRTITTEIRLKIRFQVQNRLKRHFDFFFTLSSFPLCVIK